MASLNFKKIVSESHARGHIRIWGTLLLYKSNFELKSRANVGTLELSFNSRKIQPVSNFTALVSNC